MTRQAATSDTTYINRRGARPEIDGPLTGWAALDPFLIVFHNRSLFLMFAKRDLQTRYRGTALGFLWLVGAPLILLAAYSVAIGSVIQIEAVDNHAARILGAYLALTVFQVFSEMAVRSTGILHEYVVYVKKVPFPLPMLPLIPIATSLAGAGVSFLIFLAAYLALIGWPPTSWTWLPALFVPYIMICMGCAWLFSSIGAHLRDLRHAMTLGTTALLLATPVLYPISSAPKSLQTFLLLNPLAYPIDAIRSTMTAGAAPSLSNVCILWAVSTALCCGGYICFRGLREGFADVV